MSGLFLKLPATSANLGPGFDTLALALGLYLEIEAEPADRFSIHASGRNVDICSRLEGNLLLTVYRDTVLRWTGAAALPLTLRMRNGIPLAMGCGSSAASRLAGIALASHFAALGWSRDRILSEAAQLEGHPDNAAACWLGGFVASGWNEFAARHPFASAPERKDELKDERGHHTQPSAGPAEPTHVAALSLAPPPAWHALLVLPELPLATTASRAVLPDQYSRHHAVLNLQRVAVLTAAFAAGRGDLLRSATGDSLHQPYRSAVCPLLPCLLPLAGRAGALSVTLSGAGPAVLLLLEDVRRVDEVSALVHAQADGNPEAAIAEIIDCPLTSHPAEMLTRGVYEGATSG